MTTAATTPPTKKAPRTRRRRSPSELAVAAVTRMPLGELSRFASRLVESDRATAEYLLDRLQTAVKSKLDGANGAPDVLPFDKGQATDY